MFKNKGSDIIIECNLKIVNYLDIYLKLRWWILPPSSKNLTKKLIIYMLIPTTLHFKTTSNNKRKAIIIFISKETFKETAPYYKQPLSSCRYKKN